MSPHDEQPAPADDLARACHLSGQMSAAQSIAHFGSAIAAPQAAVPAPSEAAPATVATDAYWQRRAQQAEEAYLNMRQWAEKNGLDTTACFGGTPSAERPAAQPTMRDVLNVVHKWSDTKPEPDEDWESWFIAAFDLMANEIAELWTPEAAAHGIAPADAGQQAASQGKTR